MYSSEQDFIITALPQQVAKVKGPLRNAQTCYKSFFYQKRRREELENTWNKIEASGGILLMGHRKEVMDTNHSKRFLFSVAKSYLSSYGCNSSMYPNHGLTTLKLQLSYLEKCFFTIRGILLSDYKGDSSGF